jgi:Polyketide cyclase / dehydrase and lipid transport
MKFLKPFLVFLLFVLIATAILSLLMPTKQKVERSITINAPAALIYEQLSRLENFNKWSVWTSQDPLAKYSLGGNDGTVGATSTWTGDPGLSGEGKMEITALEPGKKVAHSIQLKKPKKINATSLFTLSEGSGATIVTWNFEMATPRPWNIFNLFYSMDKEMGKDFETSLAALKEITERTTGTAIVPVKTFEVQRMDFPATRYALIRQEVKWVDIEAFFDQHIPIIIEETRRNNIETGPRTHFYYKWDEKNQLADVAAAVSIPSGKSITHNIIQALDIDASKAIFTEYGLPDYQLADARASLDKYLIKNKLTKKEPVIEEYTFRSAKPGILRNDPEKKLRSSALTQVIYLVE